MSRLDEIYRRLTELDQALEDSNRWDWKLTKVYINAQSVKEMEQHNPRHWKMLGERNDLISELAAIRRSQGVVHES